jgi:hypothetical protein
VTKQLSRRQLFRGTAVSLAGSVLAGRSVQSASAAAVPEEPKLRPGTVTRVDDSGKVAVRLDPSHGGQVISAPGSLLHQRLKVGDRVAVGTEPDGSLLASPIFVGLLGAIERYAGNQLTVKGRSCVVDDLSVVREA